VTASELDDLVAYPRAAERTMRSVVVATLLTLAATAPQSPVP
jgi:hypothetical protein